MANARVGIDVDVNAKEVDRLEARLNRVESILSRINKDPIALDDGRAAKAVKEITNKISELAKEQLKLNTINMTTIAGLKDKAAAYKLVAENAKVGGQLFKDATIASERYSRRAVTAEQERLKVLKEFYSTQVLVSKNKQPVRTNLGLEELARQQKIAFGTNSIASLEAFNSELQRTYELMSGKAPGRSQLLDMMTETDKRLQALQRPSQKAPGIVRPAGPATELGSPKEYTQRQKYADDLLTSQKKLERISVNLDAAAISQNDKFEIRNRLGEAFNAIQQRNFSLSQKLGAEADRYLRDARGRQSASERADKQRLRVQELNQKAIDKTSLYASKLQSNLEDGLSPLDAWLQKLNRIEQTAGEINDLSKQLGKEFDERLKNIGYREGSLKTPLGGGAEVSARAKYQSQINTGQEYGPATRAAEEKFQKNAISNAQKKVDLNNVLNRQTLALKTLSSNFNILEGKGVTFLDEKTKLANILAVVEGRRFDINEKNIKIIGEELKTLRLLAALRKSESEAAGTYRGQAPKTGGKSEAEAIEARRNRLLENALSLQGNLVSIEGRGGQVAQEKLEIEAKILQLKNMQNKASEADLRIIAQQIQELRIKGKTISNTIAPDQKKAPFLERRFGKERARAISEGLVGGAFPLLFGQGVGASLGGLAGGAAGGFLGGGLGFGLSLIGTSLGAALDQSVAAAKELGNALAISKDNYSELRQQGIYFTAELENQVRLAKEGGQFQKAQELQRGAVFAQTGDVDTTAIRGATAASNELQKAWNGVKSAVGTTLAGIAGPFIFALTAALRVAQGIFFAFNLIITGLAKISDLIPGVKQLRQDLEESAIRGTKEYEDQLAEINKQIAASEKLNKISSQKNNIIQRSLGASKIDYEYAVKRAEAEERVQKLEQEIRNFRASAPTGTSELRMKAVVQEGQMRIKFAEEERSTLLTNAREVFDAVNESNKRIAELKKQYEQEYRDIIRQNLREQEDFDLAVARKLQDIRIQTQEQELDYTKQIAQERIKGIELANQEQLLQGGIEAQLSDDPRNAALVNEVTAAVEEWRTGRRAVEEEYAAKQQEIQLQAQKAEIAIQRYKFDNALRVARANEESQLKVNKLQEQINKQNEAASKNDLKRQQENLLKIVEFRKTLATEQYYATESQVKLMGAAPNSFTGEQKARAEEDFAQARLIYGKYAGLADQIEQIIASIPTAGQLPSLGAAPKLTDTSGSATAASQAALDQTKAYEKQVSTLTRLNGLKEKDLELAKRLLDPQNEQLKQLNEIIIAQGQAKVAKERYRELLMSGIDPALAQELIRVEQIRDVQLETLDILIKTLEAYNDPALKDILDKLTKIRSGVIGKADEAMIGIEQAFAPGERIKDFVAESIAQLNDLESVALSVSQGIGSAIGNSLSSGIEDLVSGTETIKEVFANFLKDIGQILIQEGAKMIATYIAIGLAKQFAGLLGGGSKAAGGASGSYSQVQMMSDINAFPLKNANGNAFGYNKIMPFAMGGVVSSPTLFKFASGGAMKTGVMGEAGPEAILPLSRGSDGKLGVSSSGSGGDINVTVNVDASGSKVSGDKESGNQLGRVVSAAVQQELIRQKRPGGLLS